MRALGALRVIKALHLPRLESLRGIEVNGEKE
jgi:hypothetical protein